MLRPYLIHLRSLFSSQPRPVAFLEFLTAPAGAGIVATDAGVGIRRERGLGHTATGARFGRWSRRRRIAARDQTVGRRFGRDHGGRAPRAAGQAAGGTRDGARRTTARRAPATSRRPDLDLQFEPPLGE